MNNLELTGFQEESKIFDKLIKSQKLPHAILLSGERSIGKSLFAKSIAFKIIKKNLIELKDPLSHFSIASIQQLLDSGSYPDVYYLSEEQEKSTISVEQIRNLIDSLSLKSYYPFGAIAIIDNAENMTISAANSLLKCLEEPEENKYFILVSSMPHLIPETIRSRTQEFACSPRTKKELSQILDKILINSTKEEITSVLDLLDSSLEPLNLGNLNIALPGSINEIEKKAKEEAEKLLPLIKRIREILSLSSSLQRKSQIIQFFKEDDKKAGLLKQKTSLLLKEIRNLLLQNETTDCEDLSEILFNLVRRQSDIGIRHLDSEINFAEII